MMLPQAAITITTVITGSARRIYQVHIAIMIGEAPEDTKFVNIANLCEPKFTGQDTMDISSTNGETVATIVVMITITETVVATTGATVITITATGIKII